MYKCFIIKKSLRVSFCIKDILKNIFINESSLIDNKNVKKSQNNYSWRSIIPWISAEKLCKSDCFWPKPSRNYQESGKVIPWPHSNVGYDRLLSVPDETRRIVSTDPFTKIRFPRNLQNIRQSVILVPNRLTEDREKRRNIVSETVQLTNKLFVTIATQNICSCVSVVHVNKSV